MRAGRHAGPALLAAPGRVGCAGGRHARRCPAFTNPVMPTTHAPAFPIAGRAPVRWVISLALLAGLAAAAPASAGDTAGQRATLKEPPDAGEAPSDPVADIEARKSYWIPVAEIFGFDFLLNQFDRYVLGANFASNGSTIRANLHTKWRTDSDSFTINQLGHPYQGSMYHGFARSAGLNYWESLGYTLGGSAAWEIAGEATPPSFNDQITTGFGGSFLGEALFRMSNLVLEKSDMPKFWRELGAAVISPPTGLNRLAFGNRFSAIYPSNDAIYYGRFGLGLSTATHSSVGTPARFRNTEAMADFSLDYGLPGKAGYNYDRPFDYFAFQATASSANIVENVMTRGLLLGAPYEAGKNYRGVWGLYGSFDYIEPQIFRVSSTALSIGTTAQWWLARATTLQFSALAGAGYAAVGTVNGTTPTDYRFGVAPQTLLSLRLIHDNRVSLDAIAREYFVKGVADTNTSGYDNIIRAEAALTVRVYRNHAIALKYLLSRRDTYSPALGERSQDRSTIGLYYIFLGNDGFGAVDWRADARP